MTYINNSDDSSMIRFHNDINSHIYGGGNVSHTLNVNIIEPPIDDQIRQQVFNKINNVPITFNINNLNVVITWRSNDNLHYYHADVMGIYGDVAVKLPTEMLLKLFDEDCFVKSKLSFMVNKPLVRTNPI